MFFCQPATPTRLILQQTKKRNRIGNNLKGSKPSRKCFADDWCDVQIVTMEYYKKKGEKELLYILIWMFSAGEIADIHIITLYTASKIIRFGREVCRWFMKWKSLLEWTWQLENEYFLIKKYNLMILSTRRKNELN